MVKQILIIIRRVNGDVLLTSPLIQHLRDHYEGVDIDLLVNDDTLAIAKALRPIRQIHVYSYQWKKLPLWARLQQHWKLVRTLYQRYDLAISLTTTDSSVLYARLGGRTAMSAIDVEASKNWWKKRLLNHYYLLSPHRHMILNNLEPLRLLGIPVGKVACKVHYSATAHDTMQAKLRAANIKQFLIFHPSAQHGYKVYPEALRHALLGKLSQLGIAIIVTGAKTPLDLHIKANLPVLPNVHDWIGATSMEEYIALSEQALAYVGGDTLNMHIAAVQDKPIFAIFGPTLLPIWSPWNNALQTAATHSQAQQTYGNITIFQADMPCVPCGKAGCDDQNGNSECLSRINPATINTAVSHWLHHYHQESIHDQN